MTSQFVQAESTSCEFESRRILFNLSTLPLLIAWRAENYTVLTFKTLNVSWRNVEIKALPWSVLKVEPIACLVIILAAYNRAQVFGETSGIAKKFLIFGKMIYKCTGFSEVLWGMAT